MKLTDLKGIGDKTARLLNKLSVYTAEDLVRLYPRSYDICGKPVLVSEIPEHTGDSLIAVDAVVARTPALKRVRNLQILTVTLRDEKGGLLKATWFNMPYLLGSLKPGYRYIFRGRPVFRNGDWVMEQPVLYTMEGYSSQIGIMQPIYPLTKGLSNKIVSKAMQQALDIKELVPELLPAELRRSNELAEINFAMRAIHFPKDMNDYEAARKRLVFDEFFFFMLNVRRMKENNSRQPNLSRIADDARTDEFIKKLPYELTNAQKRTWQEVSSDMNGERLMNRLVQGDVGSGKTIIAVLALMNTVYAGYQGAMMVPTEVLARQQYDDTCAMFEKYGININVSLLIGSMTASAKKKERQRIASGEAGIVIGTHALIQAGVEYANLGLVVTDEQHRFGVNQRNLLASKGPRADLLLMSATPIPRTLALTLYGDLDITTIQTFPFKKRDIVTKVLPSDAEILAIKIKEMLDACYQAKRIREMLPPLPQGVMPSYIQYLDAIQKLEKKDIHVKVSDISDIMNLPRPGVTRTVKEMEKKGYLSKIASPDDGRVTYISITEEGWKLFHKYDEHYFGELSADLSDISEEDADCMIRTIEKFYQIMCERRSHYDK